MNVAPRHPSQDIPRHFHGLWSLWDMHKFKVAPLLAAQDVLTQMSVLLHSDDSRVSPHFHDVNKADLRRLASDLGPELVAEELEMCRKGVSRLLATIDRTADAKEIAVDIDDLRRRLFDQMGSAFCLLLTGPEQRLYEPSTPLFGAEVEAKFPTMSEDVAEAGKSLAVGRSTASVFHLMRAMEIALQRLGATLQIALVGEKNWQNILDEVNKAIKALDPKAIQTKAYAEASAHLYNVKLCWRNEVMHPKQTYTPDEAHKLFSAVETFIRDLTGVL